MTRHVLTQLPGGAECSCGREFSVWKQAHHSGWSAAHDAQRGINLAKANARRHADAANRREAEETKVTTTTETKYPKGVNRLEMKVTPDHVRDYTTEGRLAEAGNIICHPETGEDYAVLRVVPLASRAHLWVCPIDDAIDEDGTWRAYGDPEPYTTLVLTYFNGVRAYFA